MAILKFFGVEIRTGRDQSHYQKAIIRPPKTIEHDFNKPVLESPIAADEEYEQLLLEEGDKEALARYGRRHFNESMRASASEQEKPRNRSAGIVAALVGRLPARNSSLNGLKIATPFQDPRKAYAKEVIYPSPSDVDSIWNNVRYEQNVLECQKMLTTGDRFDICVVNNLRDICHLCRYNVDIYDYLRAFHCKAWCKISDRDVKLIFVGLTHVFTDGRVDLLDPDGTRKKKSGVQFKTIDNTIDA